MFKQKKLSAGARFGLWIVSFILCVLLLVSTLAAVLMGNVLLIGDKLALESGEEALPSEPVAMAPAGIGHNGFAAAKRLQSEQMPEESEQADESVPAGVADELTQQLFKMFYDGVSQELGEEFPVTLDEFIELVERSTVKDYISEKTTALIVDYFNGEVTTTFEPEEIVELIEENEDLIIEVTGEPIPEDIAQEIARVFDENEIVVKVEQEGLAGFIEMAGVEIPGVSDIVSPELMSQVRTVIDIVRSFFSTQNMLICLGISVLLTVLVLLVNCKQLGKGMRRISYPLMLVGLLSAVNIFAMCTPDLWSFLPILSQLRDALVQTAWLNFTVLGLGFVLFIAGVVVGFITKSQLKKAAAKPAANVAASVAAAGSIIDAAASVVESAPVEEKAVEEAAAVEEVAEEEAVAEEVPEEEAAAPAEEATVE